MDGYWQHCIAFGEMLVRGFPFRVNLKRPNEMRAENYPRRELRLSDIAQLLHCGVVCMLEETHQPSLLNPVGHMRYRSIICCKADKPQIHTQRGITIRSMR